jgi:hypothetical protein
MPLFQAVQALIRVPVFGAIPQNPRADKAPLRLGKRDRPSRLHPRIARSGEGDARVKAGGASGKHLGRTTEPELITRRGTHGGTVRLDTSTMPALIAYFRPV